MVKILEIENDLLLYKDDDRAQKLKNYFQADSGEYAEGDVFIGVLVPFIRKIAKKYEKLSWDLLQQLLFSNVHEERFLALLILIKRFKTEQEAVFNFYKKNINNVNHWDLVDLSAPPILGAFLYDKPKDLIFRLAKSPSVWHRRIAMISTHYNIKKGSSQTSIKVASLLRAETVPIIQRSVGWMLRETAKIDLDEVRRFLDKYGRKLSPLIVRCTLESFPIELHKEYTRLLKRRRKDYKRKVF